jgi:hypothetical protein
MGYPGEVGTPALSPIVRAGTSRTGAGRHRPGDAIAAAGKNGVAGHSAAVATDAGTAVAPVARHHCALR